jgi:hypothetical protein
VVGNPERGIAAGETSGAFHHDKSVQDVRLQAMLLQERSANGGLQGREREVAIGIALDDALDRHCTEVAHAIEEDNGMVGLHVFVPPPSDTDALRGLYCLPSISHIGYDTGHPAKDHLPQTF